MKHICSEFEKLTDRTDKKAVDDLYAKWEGSGKTLEQVIRLVTGTGICMNDCSECRKGRCKEKGKDPSLCILKVPTASLIRTRPDDGRADTGEAASTSTKAGQKQKGKKKSKRTKKPDKGRGKK